jgi:pullulanase
MEAYLDDYGKINVYVNSRFYGGVIDKFYLKNTEGKFYNCLVARIEKSKDFFRYELSLPLYYNFALAHQIVGSHGYQTDLIVRNIVNTEMFRETFAYDGDDLGSLYTPQFTDFATWAPTASSVALTYFLDGKRKLEYMERSDQGVFRKRIMGNLENAVYAYMFSINGNYKRSSDPFAYSGIENDEYSGVINFSKLLPLIEYDLPKMNSYNDAIIYEMSVYDFTSDPNTNTQTNSKFVSLCEDDTSYGDLPTGLAYIKDLGVTHVQLMPVFYFATIDEEFPEMNYNWGYDPLNFGILEGAYSLNYKNPYSRMNDFRKMVNTFHKNGVRVVCDVVFNHHYDMERCNLERLVPNYSFRYTDDGFLSNGSFCGNDLESRNYMVRKYIVTLCERFIKIYGIDGLRFDLMGIIDITTMNEIYSKCSSLKKDFMIYGEGWNMPTAMDDSEKAMQENSSDLENIGFFNDGFRDIMKGSSSEHEIYSKGYVTGKIDLIPYAKAVMQGDCVNSKYLTSSQSINYVACHDNLTSFDKINACCNTDSDETKIRKQKLLMACTMFAQGVPFFHSGQEFCRTKNGKHNTYDKGSFINRIDWQRKNRYKDVISFFKDLVVLRKSRKEFKYITSEEIIEHVSFEEIFGTLVYIIDDLRIYINPTLDTMSQCLLEYYRVIFNENGIVNDSLASKEFEVPGYSILIIEKFKLGSK